MGESVLLEEVTEVGGGEMMESSVWEEDILALDVLLNHTPVKLVEDGGDVFR